ncbi:class I SAM-dependent methyltransferase [Merismopedia glauca]|uniref:Class I SAM-dependent methyltransferase n=1 Tax=Merismopedia glauca CCAP 1448/3 TaxID=1296344 RepID=A0A2T1C725_9CYAN|nr:class I SAM-dependent methyltransferase [Merismopedia glauca]PSB04082.1 hypothetical protein C7B64_05460 [Merismopedia glauca CCAP 1448/3]
MNSKLSTELNSFQNLWNNGYYEGDPLQPLASSSYGQLNYMSVLHATYLKCIKPYVNSETIAVEIGPGRGAWTKALLPAKEVWGLDALSAEHNQFFEYLDYPQNVKYFQVTDFTCSMLPNDYFNYMFSFGCLCHVSFQGISEYAANIFPKLKKGSNCFWMIADYQKYNQAIANANNLSIWRHLPVAERYGYIRKLLRWLELHQKPKAIEPDNNDIPNPGRWYDAGLDKTCSMLQNIGYEIVEADVGTVHRDPIIHFIKT